MPAKRSRHIALTAPLAEYVLGQVDQGRYASVSEVVRAAVRLLMAQDAGQGGSPSRAPQAGPASRVDQDNEPHGRG